MKKYVKGFLSLVLSLMLVGTSFISVNAYDASVKVDQNNIVLGYLDETKNVDYVSVKGALKNNDAVVSKQEVGIEKEQYDNWVTLYDEEEAKIAEIKKQVDANDAELDAQQKLVDTLDSASDEYATAKTNLDNYKAKQTELDNQLATVVEEYSTKIRNAVPGFDDSKWQTLTLKETTDTENRYSAQPSGAYLYYVTWVKVSINGVDYYNYSVNCLKEQPTVYICKVVDGKYYDNNGKEITKAEYDKKCGNPKTGNNMYYTYGAVIVIAACGLYMATRKVKKLSK